MQQILVRTADEKDLLSIYELVKELAIYEKAREEFVATIEMYREDFADGVFEAIVAELDGEVVGMALYYLSYSTWKGRMLYLEDFVIKQEYRRLGIGDLIFDKVVAEAKAKSCKLMKWQVLDWNEPALKFYNKKNAIIEKCWWTGKIIF